MTQKNEALKAFEDVENLPTPAFYFPLKANEEILVNIENGKNLLIRFRYMGEANDDVMREVFFQINGQTRNLLIKDMSVKVQKTVT